MSGTSLTYGPDQGGLHRCGGLIYVIAIETKSSLKPQAVPGSQTGQLHLAVGQQLLCQLHHSGLRDGDLTYTETPGSFNELQ